MDRFSAQKVTPKLRNALLTLSAGLSENPKIDPQLRDLIETRISQLNQCSFCVRKHGASHAAHGGVRAKLEMLPVWRAAKDFAPSERAALDWAETLTQTRDQATIDQSFAELSRFFGAEEISELTFIISTMNAFNRLGIAQHEQA